MRLDLPARPRKVAHRAPARRCRGSVGGAARVLVLALLVLAGCAPRAVRTGRGPSGEDARAWAAQSLARLSLEQKVGQLIVPSLPGGFANARSTDLREAERLARVLGVGGFVVGPGPPLETAAKLNALQRAADLPLLIAADHDGVSGGVLHAAATPAGPEYGTLFPGNMGLAASALPLHAELAGKVAAREARAVGIHWLLGPIVELADAEGDVLRQPGAFSDDPAVVIRFAGAFVRGARSAGVLATLRRFPGAASATADAGAGGLPVLAASRAELERRELSVFDGLLRGTDVGAVMLGHVLVPALTGDSVTPVSLSAAAIGLLRQRFGFAGLVVTDRLDDPTLRAVTGYAPGELAVRALEAGADVLLAPADANVAHRAIVSAVRTGRIPYNRIDESVRRLLIAKAVSGATEQRTALPDSVLAVVAAPEHRSVAGEVAAQSLVLARDSATVLPLDPRYIRRVAVIALAPAGHVQAGAALAAEVRATYGVETTYERLDPRTADAIIDAAVTRAGLAEAVVLAVFEPAGDPERGAVMRTAARIAPRLAGVSRRLAVVAFGDPVALAALPGVSTFLVAWQPAGVAAEQAAARAISGRSAITGVLPVSLPNTVKALRRAAADHRLGRAPPREVGMDSLALERIDAILLQAIHNGASPGAAVAVGRHGRLVKLRGYGRIDYRQNYADVTDSTIYDLASLTKVIGTATALGMLIERGLVDLDAPVGRYVPEWNTSAVKRDVTLRHLALHTSGLAAYGPLYRELRGRAEYRQRIARMDLTYPPGTRTVYSDFGIILLGLIIEQVAGETLDALLQREVFEPLGMRDTGFNPLEWPYAELALEPVPEAGRDMPPFVLGRIAPTEVDTLFRRTQVHGRVHDENAYALGGVAGHAGLFSSARDLAVFAQMMLNDGYYGGRRLLDPATVALLTRRASPESSRALGWDTPSGQSSAGDYFSDRSYGHTGFTGTSLWIDPERNLFVVLLTNRVNPTRENQKHVPLRRAIADLVQLAVRDVPVRRRDLFELGTR